jgi:hypothetical protein
MDVFVLWVVLASRGAWARKVVGGGVLTLHKCVGSQMGLMVIVRG